MKLNKFTVPGMLGGLAACIAAGSVTAQCWYNSGAMCCTISSMGPGTGATPCTNEADCGWSIVTDTYTQQVYATTSTGKKLWVHTGTTTKCTSSEGKCVSGTCVYGPPITVTCQEARNQGDPC